MRQREPSFSVEDCQLTAVILAVPTANSVAVILAFHLRLLLSCSRACAPDAQRVSTQAYTDQRGAALTLILILRRRQPELCTSATTAFPDKQELEVASSLVAQDAASGSGLGPYLHGVRSPADGLETSGHGEHPPLRPSRLGLSKVAVTAGPRGGQGKKRQAQLCFASSERTTNTTPAPDWGRQIPEGTQQRTKQKWAKPRSWQEAGDTIYDQFYDTGDNLDILRGITTPPKSPYRVAGQSTTCLQAKEGSDPEISELCGDRLPQYICHPGCGSVDQSQAFASSTSNNVVSVHSPHTQTLSTNVFAQAFENESCIAAPSSWLYGRFPHEVSQWRSPLYREMTTPQPGSPMQSCAQRLHFHSLHTESSHQQCSEPLSPAASQLFNTSPTSKVNDALDAPDSLFETSHSPYHHGLLDHRHGQYSLPHQAMKFGSSDRFSMTSIGPLHDDASSSGSYTSPNRTSHRINNVYEPPAKRLSYFTPETNLHTSSAQAHRRRKAPPLDPSLTVGPKRSNRVGGLQARPRLPAAPRSTQGWKPAPATKRFDMPTFSMQCSSYAPLSPPSSIATPPTSQSGCSAGHTDQRQGASQSYSVKRLPTEVDIEVQEVSGAHGKKKITLFRPKPPQRDVIVLD